MTWIPLRYVHHEVRCAFCGGRIPKAKPGKSRGTRGTKAWVEKQTGRVECLGCRSEGFRAEDERESLDRQRGWT